MVQELETRLEGQLIDRSKRPLQLTTLGQAYYEGCKGLLVSTSSWRDRSGVPMKHEP